MIKMAPNGFIFGGGGGGGGLSLSKIFFLGGGLKPFVPTALLDTLTVL